MRKSRAFSLMEVLIVLVILGLLVSLVAPMARERINKAKYQTSVIDLHAVAKAMEEYQIEHGHYPNFNSWSDVSHKDSPLREYVTKIPPTDEWDRPYQGRSTPQEYIFKGEAIPLQKLVKNYPSYGFVPGPKRLEGETDMSIIGAPDEASPPAGETP